VVKLPVNNKNMLDIKFIKQNLNLTRKALLKRMDEKSLNLDYIISLDEKRRNFIESLEKLKSKKNKFSQKKPKPEEIDSIVKINLEIKELEACLRETEKNLEENLSALPNIPADDVVAGGKENNQVIYSYKEKPKFDFDFKNHVDLALSLGLVDYERAAKMSGTGFWSYKGLGAQLEWALLSYFIDFHVKNNYQFLIPPFLLTENSAYISGHLPKFGDDLFWTQDRLCLNATSEMMLGNYHANEILNIKELPLKYFAYSPCFRREAGSYRQEERGMIRGHQFNKIELFIICQKENSWEMFDELLVIAKQLTKGLDLHYQVSKLAANDCSAAMAKTYDIEVWLPSMNIYKEISSVSNALDYQSRRGKIRYKDKTGKNQFVHTLNASALATSRLLPAILEQNQQADGSVKIPEVLKKYLPKNLNFIKKNN
jgi:seryl-tRNA synthetase